MAYQVQYGSVAMKTVSKHKRKRKAYILAGVILLAAVACVAAFRVRILDFLLGGDSAAVMASMKNFVEDLQQGDSFSQAVTAFCRGVIANGA